MRPRIKNPINTGASVIESNAASRHGSRFEHPQAFAALSMTLPDGSVRSGHGCFESIVIGRHAPSGFTSMYDVP